MKRLFLILVLVFFAPFSLALTYLIPQNGNAVIGKVQWMQALPGDNFSKIGRRYDIGYYELVEANPGINPESPKVGTVIVIPSQFILPDVPHVGVVVNLAELRVYYFPPHTNKVVTYPVGIGREGWDTPVGLTTITAKVTNPTWVVPDSIRKWRESLGGKLPVSIPPGPDNPLGAYALYLGFPGYRMHGTNEPSGVGRRSSSGCIRMWPEDIEELFSLVKVGMPLRVINMPYKAGWSKDKLYLESHTPLEEQQKEYDGKITPIVNQVLAITKQKPADIDWLDAKRISEQQNGIPQKIGIETIPGSDNVGINIIQ